MVCCLFKNLSKNDDLRLEFREARKWVKFETDSSESLAGRISKTDISGEMDIGFNYSGRFWTSQNDMSPVILGTSLRGLQNPLTAVVGVGVER